MKDKPLPYKIVSDAVEDFREHEVNLNTKNMINEIDALKPTSVPLFDEEEIPTSESVEFPLTRNNRKKRKRVLKQMLTSDRILRPTKDTDYSELYASSSNIIAHSSDEVDITAFMAEKYFAGAVKVTVGSALKSPDADQWMKAMSKEMNQLFDTDVLIPTLESDIPPDKHKIIHSTMQLKLKLLQTGEIDKYKARLCACGNELYGSVSETIYVNYVTD